MFLYAFKFVRHSEANGRRTQKTVTPSGGSSTTTDYLSDGDHEVAEYAAGATTPSKRFIYGKNVDEIIAQHEPATNSYSYAHRNHQGSVVAVSKAGGLVASSDIYTYSPYGEPNITTGFAYRYTGRRLDTETGLYYYRARYYDAQLGRFLQVDPIGYKDQMNLYAYTGNDPVNMRDPSGQSQCPGAIDGTCIRADTENLFLRDKENVVGNEETDNAAKKNKDKFSVKKGTKEKLGYIKNGKTKVAGGVKTRTGSDRYEAKGSIPKDADAVIHGHPDKDRAGFDSPADGNVPLNNNKPNYVISRDRVGVTEFKGGALQFRIIEGTLTSSEVKGLQQHLDETQEEYAP